MALAAADILGGRRRKSPEPKKAAPAAEIKKEAHKKAIRKHHRSGIDEVAFPFARLWDTSKRFYFCRSGRASGKSMSIAANRVEWATYHRCRGLCVRWQEKQTKKSQRQEFMDAVDRLGVRGQWQFTDTKDLKCTSSGSEVAFVGLEGQGGLKSLAGIDWVWIEEAHQCQGRDFKDFLLTIIRKPGIKLFLSMNPEREDDDAWTFTEQYKDKPYTVCIENDYRDNRYLSKEAREHIEMEKKTDPVYFRHAILGHFLEEDETRVLNRAQLDACVELYQQYRSEVGLYVHEREFGYDPADGGDSVALAASSGPFLEHVEDMNVKEKGQILEVTATVDDKVREFNGRRLNYDREGSVGNQVSVFYEKLYHKQVKYRAVPVRFGVELTGPDTWYDQTIQNKAMFYGHNAQMAWDLRNAANNSAVRVNNIGGDKLVPLKHCLLIDPRVMNGNKNANGGRAPSKTQFYNEMTQAVWFKRSGKIVIDKAPGGRRSPGIFDSVCLSRRSRVDSGVVAY